MRGNTHKSYLSKIRPLNINCLLNSVLAGGVEFDVGFEPIR